MESIPNRTAEQEAELSDKRNELAQLEAELRKLEETKNKLPNSETQPTNTPWGLIIGGSLGGVFLVVLAVIFVRRNKKRK